MKKVVITGGAGFIGTKLSEALLEKGYKVIVLDIFPSRLVNENLESVVIDTEKRIDKELVDGTDAVINLAGTNIGQRWNSRIKESIVSSRIGTTKNLVEAIRNSDRRPLVLVSASAVGIYGDGHGEVLVETSPLGDDFLAKVAKDWENEAKMVEDRDVRLVLIRTAHVLGKGGILGALDPIFRKHLGGYFGSGRQYMPWVHYEDIVNIYIFALENEKMKGTYNTGAGEPIVQKDFMQTFAKVYGYSPVLPIPKVLARIVLGEFGVSLFSSQKIDSTKLQGMGYNFKHKDFEEALTDIRNS